MCRKSTFDSQREFFLPRAKQECLAVAVTVNRQAGLTGSTIVPDENQENLPKSCRLIHVHYAFCHFGPSVVES